MQGSQKPPTFSGSFNRLDGIHTAATLEAQHQQIADNFLRSLVAQAPQQVPSFTLDPAARANAAVQSILGSSSATEVADQSQLFSLQTKAEEELQRLTAQLQAQQNQLLADRAAYAKKVAQQMNEAAEAIQAKQAQATHDLSKKAAAQESPATLRAKAALKRIEEMIGGGSQPAPADSEHQMRQQQEQQAREQELQRQQQQALREQQARQQELQRQQQQALHEQQRAASPAPSELDEEEQVTLSQEEEQEVAQQARAKIMELANKGQKLEPAQQQQLYQAMRAQALQQKQQSLG